MNNNRILGVTLARGGSKGIPQKNISLLDGLPLIAYTIQEALRSRYLTNYIVSTDCTIIAQVSKSLGADVPFLRPAELSSDTATSAAALKHATLYMEELLNCRFDYVVELMATNPFKTSEHIDHIIEKIIDTHADSVIGVNKLEDHHPARIKRIVDDFIVDFAVPETSSRRQDLKPDAYIRNGSIYAIKRDLLVESEYRYGGSNSRPYIMPQECAINIDTPFDLLVAAALMEKKNG